MDENVLAALRDLDVASLDRSDWIMVGMALKEGGYPCSVWDDWSRNDSRYHPGECEKKWNGFHGSGKPVKVGSIIDLAKKHGWVPNYESDAVFGWDDEISYDGDSFQGFPDKKWDPAGELIEYLETLFEPDEYVAYVTNDVWKTDEGKYVPSKGVYSRTRDQIIQSLRKWKDDLASAIGSYEPAAGAWIRFNPVDGQGVKNENVVRFTYALVESDEMPIEEQDAAYRKLELPIATLVHSGGKSLHAIVKVDARDADEYRKRVNFLYDFLDEHGVKVDKQNRNPSRLSRMPGVTRNGNRQYLVATNIGRKSWDDWMDSIDGIEDPEDSLPEIRPFSEILKDIPPLAPPLINDVLRVGRKMLITGPSKAGKSFLLIELSLAIANGTQWLNWKCEQGKVLYVNFEIEESEAVHRYLEVCKAMEVNSNFNYFFPWDLRGHAEPISTLGPKIIRKVKDGNYSAIILDPIYKILTGDENNASEMASFCNEFDKICNKTGAALIYSHHHSKGAQGAKHAMDRGSGSGVFARDPDAILDMSPLVISNFLIDSKPTPEATAFRIETSLRDFRNAKPFEVWFAYPRHIVDAEGVLKDAMVEGSMAEIYKASPNYTPPATRQKDMRDAYDAAANFNPDEPITVDILAGMLGVSSRTVRSRLKECGDEFDVHKGVVTRKENDDEPV